MNAIDTNILVYAFDSAYPEKQKICKEIILDIFKGKNQAAVTNQILAEFAAIVTKKIEKPMQRSDASAIIEAILSSSNWHVLNYTEKTVLNALQSREHFWDALIAQTLREHNIQAIVTENGKHFTSIEVIEPF